MKLSDFLNKLRKKLYMFFTAILFYFLGLLKRRDYEKNLDLLKSYNFISLRM